MYSELKKDSLVDIRIHMTFILAAATGFFYVISMLLPDNLYINIAACLFIVNIPFLSFAMGIHLDKGWLLSIIGIENNRAIPKTKEKSLWSSKVWLICAVALLVNKSIYPLVFYAIALGIYFIARMITQTMGFYIYWIARINNDPKMKTNAPDSIVIRRSLKAADNNYYLAGSIVALLLLFLLAYSLLEYIFPITSAIRREFLLYAGLVFFWIVILFILGQLFDKNAALLHAFRTELFDEQCVRIIKSSLQQRLLFMKILFVLFILAEVMILPVVIRIFN